MELLKNVEKANSYNSLEEKFAKEIAMVEYFFGVTVDEHYPLMKKINQLNSLKFLWETDAKRFGLMK